jgi:O-antigen/teichoic acid export membrane protein
MIGLSPYLVEFVLDSKWVGTEILIQLFAVAGILGIFGEMVVPILKGLGQPKKIMFIELFQSSLFVITVYFLSKQYGITGAASARIFSGAVSFISSIIFLKQIHIKPFEGNKIFISVIIVSSFLGTVVSLLILEILPSLVGFIFSTIIGISTIIFLIWISNLKFNLGISELIKKTFPQLKVLIKTNED